MFKMEINYKIPPEYSCKGENNETTRKAYNSNKIISLGSYDMRTAGALDIFDYDAKRWTKKNVNIRRRFYNVALIDNKLMIIGGTESETDFGQTTNKVDSLDLVTGSVTPAAPLNEGRNYAESVVVGKGKFAFLFVFGGWGRNGEMTDTVERWDPVSKVWTYVTPMTTVRSGCAVTVFHNKIYLLGGRSSDGYKNSVEAYDIEKDKWETKAPMRYSNAYFAATTHKNYIYMVAGNTKYESLTNAVERYDPIRDTWTSLANISSYGQVGLVSYNNDKLICVGGQSSALVQEYEEENDKWISLPSSNVRREGSYLTNLPKSMENLKFDWN